MASQVTDEKESSGESVEVISEAIENIKIESDINDDLSQSTKDRKRDFLSHSSIPKMIIESSQSLINALQQLSDTYKIGETSESVMGVDTDSSIETRELQSSCDSITVINQTNADNSKSDDLGIDKHCDADNGADYILVSGKPLGSPKESFEVQKRNAKLIEPTLEELIKCDYCYNLPTSRWFKTEDELNEHLEHEHIDQFKKFVDEL